MLSALGKNVNEGRQHRLRQIASFGNKVTKAYHRYAPEDPPVYFATLRLSPFNPAAAFKHASQYGATFTD